MSQKPRRKKPGRPLWDTDPALFEMLCKRAREYGSLGDELVSQIAEKFSNSSILVVDNPEHWVNKTVSSQKIELDRARARDEKPQGHWKMPLTSTKTNKDGESTEVDIPELADSGFSQTLSERSRKLHQIRRGYFLNLLEKHGPLAIADCGDQHRDLRQALLKNMIAVLRGRPQEKKDQAALAREYGVSNTTVTNQKGKLFEAIARRLQAEGLNFESLLNVLEELDPEDYYNVVDDTKMTLLQIDYE